MSFNTRLRGAAAAAALCLTLVGGSTKAFGQEAVLQPAVLTQTISPAPAALPAPAPAPKPTLYQLVAADADKVLADDDEKCLATAVYFEARGESLAGQLAVARVVINRAASGRYPSSWCAVVKQPWQFSFVRSGHFPSIDTSSDAWRLARGVAHVAIKNVAESVPTDVLWYHADYVAPSWGRRLQRVEKIGAHIFYRS